MILVFVGAGGSSAIDPDPKQYPTTLEFFNHLPDHITHHQLFSKTEHFLQNQKGKKKGEIDIEDILWVLDELRNDCLKIADRTTPIGWTCEGQIGFVGGMADYSQFVASMKDLGVAYAAPLISDIYKEVYTFYGRKPRHDQLADWVLLLKGLLEFDPFLEIFTTNYDRVLETAFNAAELKIETGRRDDRIEFWLEQGVWENILPPPLTDVCGRLTKLHGSVDWQYGEEGKISIGGGFTQNHANHCILYPGYKGKPTEPPFPLFHDHFSRTIQNPELSAVVFVGFAFRDEHINDLLSELPPRTHGIFFTLDNPNGEPTNTPPTRAPQLDYCVHFPSGLTNSTVRLCLRNLKVKKQGA